MIRLAKDKIGKFYIEGDSGVRVAIHKLIGRDLFSAEEIRSDILRGDLKVCSYEDADIEELLEMANSASWESQVVDRDELEKYIKFRNKQIECNQFDNVLEELKYNRKLINGQSDMIRMLSAELVGLKKSFNAPSYVTIDEVWKLFPQYNINSLRNMVSNNKYFDDNMKMMRSNLHIGEFRLEFRKPTGTKKWLADRVDFVPEKNRTFDKKFQEKILARLRHGVRYFWMG